MLADIIMIYIPAIIIYITIIFVIPYKIYGVVFLRNEDFSDFDGRNIFAFLQFVFFVLPVIAGIIWAIVNLWSLSYNFLNSL